MRAFSQTHFTGPPTEFLTTYAPDTDTFTVRFYSDHTFQHAVTINVCGPEEKRLLLADLDRIAQSLRDTLDFHGASAPSAA